MAAQFSPTHESDSASTTNPASHPELKATYASPTHSTTHIFTKPVSSPLSLKSTDIDPKSKIAYLNELRAKVKAIQEEVNVFLTEKMEEDKRSVAATTSSAPGETDKKGKSERSRNAEEEEEENYGEERVEDD